LVQARTIASPRTFNDKGEKRISVPRAAVTPAEDKPRTAFITGSSRKLGRAFALEFARRGCRLVLHALSDRKTCEATAEEVRKLSGKEVLVVTGDIGNSKDMKKIATRALEAFGVVDIVINNVGYRVHQPFLEMPEETWQRIFDVNLNGPYYACRAFAPGMVEQGWGRIVNLLGVNAMKGEEMRVALSASKHGLLGMTRALGKELGPHGVTVNAINPGYLSHELDTPEERDRINRLSATIPVRRVGERSEIAALAGFLCSNAGGYINSQMISANGGTDT
jgi:3-oxoacyl-[acyl-carrier protein] reductase